VGDIEKLFGTLWILCESQADQAGVDEVAFVTGLGGDALGSAIEAFIEAVIDFFPQAAQRAALRASRQVDQKLTTTLMQKIADMFEKAQKTTIGDS
jgi:O-acetyl-ADP-ribose deacetylase (regulator of RNase III)